VIDIWWCTAHQSVGNHVLNDYWRERPEKRTMWGGCHDSLWSFASGIGNNGQHEKVGRCVLVRAKVEISDELLP
jgi:hypothetical protein